MTGRRVLVIGLDGASPAFVRHWASRGPLSFLGQVQEEGASGVLRSTMPPYTPTAWTSIVTGVNPGRHGIFGFARVGPHGEEALVDAETCRSKPIWDLLTEAGRPSVVLNVPITYPPRPIDGVIVTGMGTPPEATRFALPEEVGDLIMSRLPGYVADVPVREDARRSSRAARAAVEQIDRVMRDRLTLAELLLDRYPWDFGMVVFEAPDRLQHLFWKVLSPEAPPSTGQDALLDVYRRLDEGLGRLVEHVASSGPVVTIIVSDHGFQDLRWLVAPNNHLAAHGFLALRRSPTVSTLARVLPRRARRTGARVLGVISSRREGEGRRGQMRASRSIDWDRTVAFCGGVFEQGIHVRPAGGEHLVDEGLVAEVEACLRAMPGPEGGDPAVADVLRRESIYDGPCIPDAANLFPVFEAPGAMMVPRVASRAVWEPVDEPHGTHHPDGLLMGIGAGVERGATLTARTEDVAATVLGLLGEPVPFEMEGRPIQGIAPEDVPRADVALARSRASETGYTPEQEAEIVERLRGLGYFE